MEGADVEAPSPECSDVVGTTRTSGAPGWRWGPSEADAEEVLSLSLVAASLSMKAFFGEVKEALEVEGPALEEEEDAPLLMDRSCGSLLDGGIGSGVKTTRLLPPPLPGGGWESLCCCDGGGSDAEDSDCC